MKLNCFLAILFSSLIIGFSVNAEEAANVRGAINREEDLRVILEETLLKGERVDQLASMYAVQVIDKSDKKLPVELVVSRLRQIMTTKESLQQLMKSYSLFSDEEIHQVRQVFENKAFLKYVENSFAITKANMQVIEGLLTKIVQENIENSDTEPQSLESAESSDESDQIVEAEILNLTEDNYTEEVEQSGKPVIVDVYANWCRPCQEFSSTFENLHQKYKKECRFARVNSEKEALLVKFLKVSAYPTTVFIHKGKVVSREVGNMSEEEFETKIQDFIQDQ